MNTQIKPVQAGFPLETATQIVINAFMPLNATTSITHWTLLNAEGKTLQEKNLAIPQEVHAIWGTDDSVIENYVLEQLGLERKTT